MSANEAISSEVKKRLSNEREEIAIKVRSFLSQRSYYRTVLLLTGFQVLAFISFVISQGLFDSEAGETIFIPFVNFELPGWVLSLIIYTFNVVIGVWYLMRIRRRLRNASKSICLFASVSAAESLEKGNLVDASFFANILFSTIKIFAEGMKIEMGPWVSSLKNVFLGDVEKISEQRSAISKAVMNEAELHNQFSHHLYLLADKLFSIKGSSDYNKIRESFQFFLAKSEKYWEPAGFLQRHKTVTKSLAALNDFMKITIVYVLLFILWLIFGYK